MQPIKVSVEIQMRIKENRSFKDNANSFFSLTTAITDTLKQQLVGIAKSLNDDKWLYEATQETNES